jgi:hypothetical protein
VTVTDALPGGLSAAALTGAGWNCTIATLICVTNDVAAPGASYPAITLTVNVANDAPASVINTASVAGGGEVDTTNNTASDLTSIEPTTTDTLAPTAPTDLAPTELSSTQVKLRWTASTDNVAVVGYQIERCPGADCSNFATVGTTAGTSYGDAGLAPSTVFTYQVRALDGANNVSEPSAALSVTTRSASGSPAPGPVTLVQQAGLDAGTTTSLSLAFPFPNAAGNWIGVAIRAGQSGQTFTVSDTRGNLYRKAVQLNETADVTTVALYYAENIAGGPNTVTVSDTLPGGTLRVALLEYAGLATANTLDGSASAQGTSAAPTSGPVTTTSAGNLVIGVLSTANPRTVTADSGHVLRAQVPAAPDAKLFVEDQRQPTAGPVSAGGVLNSADVWGAVVATFRAAAGAPPPN